MENLRANLNSGLFLGKEKPDFIEFSKKYDPSTKISNPNGFLVEIRSQDENAFLTNTIQNFEETTLENLVLSLKDIEKEIVVSYTFFWVSNVSISQEDQRPYILIEYSFSDE